MRRRLRQICISEGDVDTVVFTLVPQWNVAADSPGWGVCVPVCT